MANPLDEQGVSVAQAKRSFGDVGTLFMDRTIYHTVERTDADNNVLLHNDGTPILENQAFVTQGRRLTPELMEEALKIEKDFPKVNKLMRDQMEADGLQIRIADPLLGAK